MATTVSTSTYTTTATQIARDILSGYHGQYVFCAIAPTQDYEESYNLILCDSIDTTGNYDTLILYADTFDVIGINVDTDGYYHYTYFSAQMQSWTISRNGLLIYSSLPNTPHLQDGGAYYGFAQTVLIICVCVFVLVDRVLRHVR